MKFKTPDGTAPSPGLQRGEKMKLTAMSVGLVMVIFALAYTQLTGAKAEAEREGELPVVAEDEAPEITDTIIRLPDIDAARLEALVRDESEGEQVDLEPEALALAGRWSRGLTDAQFAALDVEDWTPALDALLVTERASLRGKALRMRGGILSLRRRALGAGLPEGWLASLRLDDGSIGYAVLHDIPEGYRSIGSWLRIEGLYLKRYRDDIEGAFVEGALIVAPSAEPSFPAFEPVQDPQYYLADVRDDGVDEGQSGIPPQPFWALMNHAQLARAEELSESIDWAAAPELDKLTLEEVVASGDEWRGMAVRVPVSKLMDARVKRAPENPAREELTCEGWIGNTTWKNVVSFSAPFSTELERGDLVYARGFFFKNLAYEPREGGLRVAPRLVLVSLDEYAPGENNAMRYLFIAVSVGAALLVGSIFLLTIRDRRSSERMRQDMIRRRRSRKAGDGPEPQAST